jgi:DHA3 family macrolide efflux protein-like MFS transporter
MKTGMRTFYTIVITQALSMIGSRVTGLALGIYLYNQTGDATPLSIVAFFTLLPMALMTSISGIFADRFDRRRLMALADFGQAIGTVLLILSFASGAFQIWHLYVIVMIQSIFSVFQGPAFMASMTMLVPEDQRPRANTIYQMAGPLSGIFAPAIAGVVYAIAGVVGALVLDLVTFIVAVAVILNVHIPHPPKTAETEALGGNWRRELLAGWRYLLSKEGAIFLVALIMLINFLFSGISVLLTPYLLERTGSEATFGVVLSIFNLGGLAGGILFSIWGGTKKRIYTAMPAVFFMSIMLMMVGTTQNVALMTFFLFFMMFPQLGANASLMALMQSKIAPDIQGRVFALIEQFAMLLQPIAVLLAGPLADNVFEPMASSPDWALAGIFGSGAGSGIALIFFIAGVVALLVAVAFFAIPSVREMDTRLPDYAPLPEDADEVASDNVPRDVPLTDAPLASGTTSA